MIAVIAIVETIEICIKDVAFYINVEFIVIYRKLLTAKIGICILIVLS